MTEDPKDNREQPQPAANSELRAQSPDAQPPDQQSAAPGLPAGSAARDQIPNQPASVPESGAAPQPGTPSPGTQQSGEHGTAVPGSAVPQSPSAWPDPTRSVSGQSMPGGSDSPYGQTPFGQAGSPWAAPQGSAVPRAPFTQPPASDSPYWQPSPTGSDTPFASPQQSFGQSGSPFGQSVSGQQPSQDASAHTGFGQASFQQPTPYGQSGPQQAVTGQFQPTGSGSVPSEYGSWTPREHTTPMPPYPHAYGSGGGQQPPTGPVPTIAGSPFGSEPGATTASFASAPYATAAPRRRGRGGLVAGAIVLALVAGGVGGAVGALVADSGNGSSIDNALDSSSPNANPASVTAPAGSVQAVAQKVLPSVVMIKVAGDSAEGEGSGVILSSDGLILTNNHVASGAGQNAKMQVQFKDGSTTTASVVGIDPVSDLAVIRAAGKSGLKPIELGTSSNLQVGQSVVAVGSPLGLAGTVTTGIVSALNRPVATGGESGGTGTVISAVQTDAPINPGNSGGALVDMNGKLIGINTAIATLGASESSGQQSGSIGLGFAIPIDQARRVADQLTKTGKVVYAQIGISVNRNDDTNGARAESVVPNGPAAQAGIPTGSIVTKVGDQIIDSGNALVAIIRSHQPGDKIKVTYTDANGQNPKTVDVTLAGVTADGTH